MPAIHQLMGPCLCRLSLEVTKQLFLLLPVIRNITQFISHQAYSLILPAAGMEMRFCLSHFCQYQKVCDIFYFTFYIVSIYTIASKRQRKRAEFQLFCRQLYHRCLEIVFEPLRPYMETHKVVKCPDGHFRRAIFSLGPYIADYPEQVWLAGIVYNWCPK